MVGKSWLLVLCMFVCLSSVSAQTLLPRKYPSARVAHCLPGDGYQAPTDQEAIDILMGLYGRADEDAVKLWESQFADFTSGGHTGVAAYNANYRATAYVYFQSIYTRPNGRDTGLRKIALSNGWDFESFALHFKEDTYIDANAIGFTDTVLYGKAFALGYVPTYSDNCNMSLGSNATVLGSGSKNGLWVAVAEPVAEITIPITQAGDPGASGQVVIEYVNAVDADYKITGWGQAIVTYDGTNGFRQTGTVKWLPPADWKWCIPAPPHTLGSAAMGPNMGCYIFRVRAVNFAVTPRIDTTQIRNQCLRQVLQLVTTGYRRGNVLSATSNTIRITTGPPSNPTSNVNKSTDFYKGMTIEIIEGKGAGQTRSITASTSSSTPTLTVSPNWDTVPDTTSRYRIIGPTVMVPGWDPANDTNGDGHVDDTEFANRPNPNASARFRWEARVTTGGGWASSNATCRANLWNPQYRQALVLHYAPSFTSGSVVGYDNDDATVLVSYSNTLVLHGGRIWEYGDAPLGWDSSVNISYRDAFLETHAAMAQAGVQWRGTNISTRNMILSSFTRPYLQYFTFFRCEQTFMDCTPLTSYSGLLRNWKLVAYAAAGVRSVAQFQTNYGNFISVLGNTREAWERLTENKLAMYYLIQVPDYIFFQNWNRTFDYGSFNTVVGTSTRGFWKAGVPQNMAYTPVKMLQVDIGQPANSIPPGYEAVEYTLGESVGSYSEYYKIGNSTQNTLNVPVDGGSAILQVPVIPTHMFYLWRTSQTTSGVPNDAVVARMYTNGLVLCRMPGISPPGGTASYISNVITVQLPGGPYRRVNYDGTLGPPVDEIQIRGFEGVILVKAAQTNVPNVQLSLSVDKQNPKPLDVVTVTVTARNTGTGATSNVEIRVPLSKMTYEQGSLSPSDCTTDTSERDVLKIRVPHLAPGETKEIRFRAVVRRGE